MNSATDKPNFIGHKPTEPRLRRAAQYVRMSTDHQQYSIASQKAAIAEYAAFTKLISFALMRMKAAAA